MSIRSSMGPGEEDGMGGVLTQSEIVNTYSPLMHVPYLPRPSIVPKRFEVKRDRRGVGNCGLEKVNDNAVPVGI